MKQDTAEPADFFAGEEQPTTRLERPDPVVVIHTEAGVMEQYREAFAHKGLDWVHALSTEHVLTLSEKKGLGPLLVDLDSVESASGGLAAIRFLSKHLPRQPIVVITARMSVQVVLDCMRAGARDVVQRHPERLDELAERLSVLAGEPSIPATADKDLSVLLTDIRHELHEFLRRFMSVDRDAYERSLEGSDEETIRILFVDGDKRLHDSVARAAEGQYEIDYAATGGEAMDRLSGVRYQLVLVATALPDLPDTLVMQTARSSNKGCLVLSYKPGGKVDVVEADKRITVIETFSAAKMLWQELENLGNAYRARNIERRFLQAFKGRHGSLLRTLQQLRNRIDAHLGSLGGR